MEFDFRPITVDVLNAISKWRYQGFVKDIDVSFYFETMKRKAGGMKNRFGFGAYLDDELVGFFEFHNINKGVMEISLALHPDWVGKGLSFDFLNQGIRFGVEQFNYKREAVRLKVNVQNVPALKTYQKAGFIKYNSEKNTLYMKKYL